MNEEKLRLLFEAYLRQISEGVPEYPPWDVVKPMSAGYRKVSMAQSKDAKKDIFVNEVCGAAVAILPKLDWSLLPVLSKLEPRMICDEVLFYINTPQEEQYTVTYLQRLLLRIKKRAEAQHIPMPSEEIAAQNLILLRYFRQTERRSPFLAYALDPVCSYLESVPERFDYDYLHIRQFHAAVLALTEHLFLQFRKTINELSMERVKNKGSFLYRDRCGHQLATDILVTVVTKDLLGIMTASFNPVQGSGETTLQQLYLENAKEAVSPFRAPGPIQPPGAGLL